MYREERQSVNKSSSLKKTARFISSTLKSAKGIYKKHHIRGERCDAKLKSELNKELCRQ
jgi:hypothetical protein